MTTSTDASGQGAAVADPEKAPGGRTPRRVRTQSPRRGIVAVLVISLLCAGGFRAWAMAWQHKVMSGGAVASRSGLGSMNSFALGLLLGGLRGPLVMFLWASSESQKTEHDLEDFDTKIEWIRLLQPEFDTVHIFQIWNKAYNISVMMASPATKYVTILQALDYAKSVDKDKPGDINILSAMAQVYGNKMAGPSTTERAYYTKQLRMETLPDEARKRAFPEEKRFRRLGTQDQTLMLDEDGNLKPALLFASRPRPAGVEGEWNDGSALQYLKTYAPFPYGIAPLALGFNYDKRAQVALSVEGQKPLQLSPMVVDSRPGLDLKTWAEQESARGRTFARAAFGLRAVTDPTPQDTHDLANLATPDKIVDRTALQAAVATYGLCERLATDGLKEYDRHLFHSNPDFLNRFRIYTSHIADLSALQAMAAADHSYYAAVLASGAERAELLQASAKQYQIALDRNVRVLLRFYTEDSLVATQFPKGYHREDVDNMGEKQLLETFGRVVVAATHLQYQDFADERNDYSTPINHAMSRLANLGALP